MSPRAEADGDVKTLPGTVIVVTVFRTRACVRGWGGGEQAGTGTGVGTDKTESPRRNPCVTLSKFCPSKKTAGMPRNPDCRSPTISIET